MAFNKTHKKKKKTKHIYTIPILSQHWSYQVVGYHLKVTFEISQSREVLVEILCPHGLRFSLGLSQGKDSKSVKRISHRQVGPEERVERLPAGQDFLFFGRVRTWLMKLSFTFLGE